MDKPESVIYDVKRERLYVSNVQGNPPEKDGQGYIAIVSLEGQLLEKEWINGLNAPKGMTIVGDTLYVADVDALVAISIPDGKVANRYEAEGAKFLNDVTADKMGNIYVSDMFTNKIHCLCKGAFSVWLEDKALENPNGLLAEKQYLVVGSWGAMTGKGFATSSLGSLKQIGYDDKKIKTLYEGKPIGNLDGVTLDGDEGYYVTDFMAGKLFHFSAEGTVKEMLQLRQGSADHAYLADKKLLLIPMMLENQLRAFRKN
ncbi:MAG: hypothetical protein BWK79_12230 [Beggiatoa sp. IS2]|nr:MAG: hypothetical protein BWK79_12230 [Beggiatoa sp. IS2]